MCLVDVADSNGRKLYLCLVADVRAGDDLVLEELVQHLPYPVDSRGSQDWEHHQPQDHADPGFALKLQWNDYRDALKDGPQVVWNRMRFAVCSSKWLFSTGRGCVSVAMFWRWWIRKFPWLMWQCRSYLLPMQALATGCRNRIKT